MVCKLNLKSRKIVKYAEFFPVFFIEICHLNAYGKQIKLNIILPLVQCKVNYLSDIR